jgi:hypothetical protein
MSLVNGELVTGRRCLETHLEVDDLEAPGGGNTQLRL